MLTDGFPRTMPQLHFFLAEECKNKRDFVWVYYDISRETAIERILNRAKEQNRADDMDMNTINRRLDTFEKETLPVIKYFESIWKLITVKADVSVDEIYQDMIKQVM
jgi:adenylate kinase family enzyme